jgi:hypothetical protein
MSSPVIGGETEQAYRAKWEGGGLGDGLPAYQDNKFMSSPSPAPKPHVYSTNVSISLLIAVPMMLQIWYQLILNFFVSLLFYTYRLMLAWEGIADSYTRSSVLFH